VAKFKINGSTNKRDKCEIPTPALDLAARRPVIAASSLFKYFHPTPILLKNRVKTRLAYALLYSLRRVLKAKPARKQ
jgi:hypothetical protein